METESSQSQAATGQPSPTASANTLVGQRIGAGLLIAAEIYVLGFYSITLGLWILPLVLGAAIALARLPSLTGRIISSSELWHRRKGIAASKTGKFARFVSRPVWAGAHRVSNAGSGLRTSQNWSDHTYAGFTLVLLGYYFGLALAVLAFFGYIALVIVIAIIALFVGFWLLGIMLGWNNDTPRSRRGDDSDDEPSLMRRVVESRKKETIFGDKYVEHRDKNGKVVAKTHADDGFLGMDPHLKTVDMDGNVVEETRRDDGFLGLDPHLRHVDESTGGVEKSRESGGFLDLDPHVERRDSDGNVVQEVRHDDGFLGLDSHSEHTNS